MTNFTTCNFWFLCFLVSGNILSKKSTHRCCWNVEIKKGKVHNWKLQIIPCGGKLFRTVAFSNYWDERCLVLFIIGLIIAVTSCVIRRHIAWNLTRAYMMKRFPTKLSISTFYRLSEPYLNGHYCTNKRSTDPLTFFFDHVSELCVHIANAYIKEYIFWKQMDVYW